MATYALASLLVVSLVKAFLVRVHNVSSGSMQNTLGVTDRVLSSWLPHGSRRPASPAITGFPAHGDTWDSTVRSPDPSPLKQAARTFGDITGIGISNSNYTVKRVIGLAGDTVACCDTGGRVLVNNQPLTEPYLFEDIPFRAGSVDCATDPRSTRCSPHHGAGRQPVGDGRPSIGVGGLRVGCRSALATADCAKFVRLDQVTGKVIAKAWPPGPVGWSIPHHNAAAVGLDGCRAAVVNQSSVMRWRRVWVWPSSRRASSKTFAVSMHTIEVHSSSPKSAMAAALSAHGFHTTVLAEPILLTSSERPNIDRSAPASPCACRSGRSRR